MAAKAGCASRSRSGRPRRAPAATRSSRLDARRLDRDRLERALAADAARRRGVEAALEPRRIEAGRVHLDGVRGEVVGEARARRPQPLGEAEAERELLVVPGRPHRDRDGPSADPDLERLLDGDAGPLGLAAGSRSDLDGAVLYGGASLAAAGTSESRGRSVARSRPYDSSRAGADRRLGGVASTPSPGSSAERALRRAARRARATPGSPRSATAIPCGPRTPRALLALAQAARDRPRRDRPRGAARRRRRRRAAARRHRRLRAERRGRSDRGLEGLREGGDGGGRRADGAATLASPGRPASSRPTGSPPARASSSAGPRTSSTRRSRAASALGGPLVIEELLEGEELSVFALTDGADAIPLPPARDYKRARRRRHRPEHRRHGRLLAASRRPGRAERRGARRAVHRPVLDELARRGDAVPRASSSRA